MKLRFLLSLASLATLAHAGPFADTIRPHVARRATAGAVFLVAGPEKVLACEAAGLADIAAQKPMREDSFFWIASITKSFTAACVMMLVDEGKLALDDPVSNYIPEFAGPKKIAPNNAEKLSVTNLETDAPVRDATRPAAAILAQTPITIRHLLSHTSGLHAGPAPGKNTTLAQFAALRGTDDLLFEPGSDYSYSNAGINVAGRVVEIAGGLPYKTFLQKRLLDPLGMTDTTLAPDARQIARLATSYKGDPKTHTLSPLSNTPLHPPMPAGGLYSTAADLARFGQLLLNKGVFDGKRLLGEAAVAEMTRRQTPPGKAAYGLGISLYSTGAFGHSGAYATNFTVWPKDNRVTVFMVQRAKSWGSPDGGKLQPALEKTAREYQTTGSRQ